MEILKRFRGDRVAEGGVGLVRIECGDFKSAAMLRAKLIMFVKRPAVQCSAALCCASDRASFAVIRLSSSSSSLAGLHVRLTSEPSL